jgi:hypothetical protein
MVRAAHDRENGWYTSFTLCKVCISLPTSCVTHLLRDHNFSFISAEETRQSSTTRPFQSSTSMREPATVSSRRGRYRRSATGDGRQTDRSGPAPGAQATDRWGPGAGHACAKRYSVIRTTRLKSDGRDQTPGGGGNGCGRRRSCPWR